MPRLHIRLGGLAPLFAALALALTSTGQAADAEEAVFGGGCFWCMEEAFDPVEGVLSTTSGFSGGDTDSPTYAEVAAGGTGHAEVVRVEYDPDRVDYAELLHVYWRNVDPFAVDRQFCDSGDAYRSAIFVADEEQRRLAEATRDQVAGRFDRKIATEITDLERFWAVEDAHQNYYQTHPMRYRFYKSGCGRKERLHEIWGDEAGGLGEVAQAE